MPASERVIGVVVRGWIEKAENDLKNAALTLRAGLESPTDTVAFHAQQCVEKYLKALLTLRGIDFPVRDRRLRVRDDDISGRVDEIRPGTTRSQTETMRSGSGCIASR